MFFKYELENLYIECTAQVNYDEYLLPLPKNEIVRVEFLLLTFGLIQWWIGTYFFYWKYF